MVIIIMCVCAWLCKTSEGEDYKSIQNVFENEMFAERNEIALLRRVS